jgi:hypothetical protein
MSLIERVEAVIETLNAERALAPAIRTTRADDTQLEFALDLLQGLRARIARHEPPSGEFAHPNLSRMVTESWNLSSPLARDLVEVEQLYLRSGKR